MYLKLKGYEKNQVAEFFGDIAPNYVKIYLRDGGEEVAEVLQEIKFLKDNNIIGVAVEITEGILNNDIYKKVSDKLFKKLEKESKEVLTEILEDLKIQVEELKKNNAGLNSLIKLKEDKKPELVHEKFTQICNLINNDFNVFLVGPAGTGKSTIVEQVAEFLKLEIYYNNSVQNSFDILGYYDANSKFIETEFYKAFTKGGIYFLDEVDTAAPDALIVLNTAIANKKIAFACGTFIAHENFKVVMGANTFGFGATSQYIGRNALDGATLDRFIKIDFNYSEIIELSIIENNQDFYEVFKNLREKMYKNELICSTRALKSIYKLLKMYKNNIITFAEIENLIFYGVLFGGISKNQIQNLELYKLETSSLNVSYETEIFMQIINNNIN